MSSDILQKIARHTQEKLDVRRAKLPFDQLKQTLSTRKSVSDNNQPHSQNSFSSRNLFDQIKTGKGPRVIAEVKRQSPSQGQLKLSADPVEIAQQYCKAGAAAISVLTEEDYFKGSLKDLQKVRLNIPDKPILQKDFIIDPYQIYEAKLLEADAILLIVSLLGLKTTYEYYQMAVNMSLTPLVEVHDENEYHQATQLLDIANGRLLIGVNNRNLRTLEVSLDVSRKMASKITPDVVVISESGITNKSQILELQSLGFSGFLIGTSLMQNPDPGLALSNLIKEAHNKGTP